MQFVHNILTQYWIRTLFESELLALCAAHHLIFCQKRAVFLSPVSSNLPPSDSLEIYFGVALLPLLCGCVMLVAWQIILQNSALVIQTSVCNVHVLCKRCIISVQLACLLNLKCNNETKIERFFFLFFFAVNKCFYFIYYLFILSIAITIPQLSVNGPHGQ